MGSIENIKWENKDITSLGKEEELTEEDVNERMEALAEMDRDNIRESEERYKETIGMSTGPGNPINGIVGMGGYTIRKILEEQFTGK